MGVCHASNSSRIITSHTHSKKFIFGPLGGQIDDLVFAENTDKNRKSHFACTNSFVFRILVFTRVEYVEN